MKALLLTSALMLLSANAIAGVSNPPTYPVPPNPAGWCTATQLVPGTVRTTQIGDCPQAPPTSCPAGRRISGTVNYNYGNGSMYTRNYGDANSVLAEWPGVQTRLFPWPQGIHPTIMALGRNEYIALPFVVPTNLPTNQWGILYQAESLSGPGLTVSFSNACGQFTEVPAYCSKTSAAGGSQLIKWRVPTANIAAACSLVPGSVVWINIKIADPYVVRVPECGASGTSANCKFTLLVNHTP